MKQSISIVELENFEAIEQTIVVIESMLVGRQGLYDFYTLQGHLTPEIQEIHIRAQVSRLDLAPQCHIFSFQHVRIRNRDSDKVGPQRRRWCYSEIHHCWIANVI